MKTGCTAEILSKLRRARRAMTTGELVEALRRRYLSREVSSALVNLVRQGRVRRIRLMEPKGRCRSAYAVRPIKEACARPKSACLLAEIYG